MKRAGRRWILPLLVLVAMFSAGALAQSSAIVGPARLSPPAPGLGESASLQLGETPADSTAFPRGFGVQVRPTQEPSRFEVIPVRIGRVGLVMGPPSASDTLVWEVMGQLESAHPDSLRPLSTVGPIRPNWLPTVLLGLTILGPLLFLIWRLLRRRRGIATPFELPPEPAHHAALRRLAEIEGAGWLAGGETQRFYVEASHALRRYVGDRFCIPALDWTSTEVVERLLQAGHAPATIRQIDPLLSSADGVKFAGALPTEHQAQEWLRAVRDWIGETAVEPIYTTTESVLAAQRFNRGG